MNFGSALYVLVYNLIHFKERNYNERSLNIISSVYPRWRQNKDKLNYEFWLFSVSLHIKLKIKRK